jgi:ribosomal-protein-alanine N-acetyltransferase
VAKGLQTVPLTEGHIEAVVAIESLSNPSPWRRESFVREVSNPDGVTLVGLVKGEVVGFCSAWVVVDEAHVINVAVAQDLRRSGIGRALVSSVLERCRERGATCATLEARASNEAAIGLYASLGFADCGRRKRYYPDGEDAVVMWLYEMA